MRHESRCVPARSILQAQLPMSSELILPSPRPDADSALLVLIRHAESVANAERRFTRHDDEPLTPLGEDQARGVGRLLSKHDVRFDALYASPFLRTVQTAELAGAAWRLEARLDERLREQSFGEFAGRPYEDFYPQVAGLGPEERWDAAAPGGESLRDVAQRVAPALVEIGHRHIGESVLLAVHGGVLAALRGQLTGDWARGPVPTDNVRGYGVRVARPSGDERLEAPRLGRNPLNGPVLDGPVPIFIGVP